MPLHEPPPKEQTCCFTGHRPEKLTVAEQDLKAQLRAAIEQARAAGYCRFITGMSRGTDLWAAEVVLQMKAHCPRLVLTAAIPCQGFEAHWDSPWRRLFSHILSQADDVRYISSCFSPYACTLRNRWMVDQSSLLIAAYNGHKGGTRDTIAYARRSGCACSLLPMDQLSFAF